MHRRQRTGAGSFLGLRSTTAVGTFGTGEDTAGSEDEDVTVREFLFELTGETLLDFVEARKQGNRDEDDDGFFAVADFELEGFRVSVAGDIRCVSKRWFCQLVPSNRGEATRVRDKIGVMSLPHGQRRIVAVSEHSSDLEYWFRVRTEHSRYLFPIRKGSVWKRHCQQFC